MDGASELNSWATREGLSAEILAVLRDEGFISLEQIKSTLHPDEIKAYFQDTKLLRVAQCLALKKAVTTFSEVSDGISRPSPQASSSPSQPFATPTYTSHPSQHSPSHSPSFPPHSQAQVEPVRWNTSAEQRYRSVDECAGAMSGLSLSGGGNEESFTFLLLGKTGSGKSTTGNTIFGERLFDTAATFSSVTSACDRKTHRRNGRKIEIIDSPGLYDTHKTQEEICVTIVQAVAGMHPGPHAILYVVRLGRYTAEEYGAYQRLKALFDEDITKYMIVLFTYGDALEREQSSIEKVMLSGAPENLQTVLRECNNRYVVFNNVTPDTQPQVEHLLSMVRQVVAENGGEPYSCPKYLHVGQGMEDEVERRIQEVEKREMQRMQYVQQLEKQTQEAEEKATKARSHMEDNERERQRRIDEEEEKRQRLEDQLIAHIQEQEEKSRRHQEELQRMKSEREEQERMMREKEHEMTEKEKKRAEEAAEAMRQREEDMQDMMKKQEECFAKQREEDVEMRRQLEKDREAFAQLLEEQRRKEKEELEEREEQQRKLMKHKMKEERAEAKKKQELYEKEMETLKQSYFTKQQAAELISMAVNAVAEAVKLGIQIWELKQKGCM
ncbi:uncharacterized protein [Littorina saxatilis]|uniref:AIG1-type G domain-containing protein n=1 Tax=Littorina saxatilis TaxID=31220 RepID=A0AAN9G2T3_9CAEN